MHVLLDRVERVVISHWHSDHSGGLLSFLNLRNATRGRDAMPCVVDVHPDRPIARGIAPGPTFDKVICRLPDDPTFELIEREGGVLEKHSEGHTVADNTLWVSGEIPRVTPFESGLPGHMRWVEGVSGETGKWTKEWVC